MSSMKALSFFGKPSSKKTKIAESTMDSNDFRYADLQLPASKKSGPFVEKRVAEPFFAKVDSRVMDEGMTSHCRDKEASETKKPVRKTSAVGTVTPVYANGDSGLFETVFQAWANHWNLRTSPDDWWLPVITKVAKEIDDKALSEEVNQLFRKGKKEKDVVEVEMPSFTIYDTNYNDLFDAFAEEIEKRIEVEGYVQTVTSDFSTTTPIQAIASKITMMKSFKKYFDYRMMMCGCGIKGLEMKGTEQDWADLVKKLRDLKKKLAPAESALRLGNFFSHAEMVFENLHKTYVDPASMRKFWAKVLIEGKDYEYGPSGMGRTEVDAYNGWLVQFLTGRESLKAQELALGEYTSKLSNLSTCPLKIIDAINNVEDDATLVGGVLGYTVHPHTETMNGVVSLEPAHGWSLMLPPNSPLRR